MKAWACLCCRHKVATSKPDEPASAVDSEWTRSSDRRVTRVSAQRGTEAKGNGQTGRTSHGLSLKGRALALLARREHSRAELRSKLAAHAESAENLERMLDELAARGFLSDARVADSIVHQRAARLGSARIQLELDRKGISPELSAPALAALRDSESDRAWALWQSKFGRRAPPPASAQQKASPEIDDDAERGGMSSATERRELQASLRQTQQRERARQQRFLLSRGFSATVVSATLRRVGQEHSDADEDDRFCE